MSIHFAYPLTLSAGKFVTVTQGTAGEIEGNVEAILRCPKGHRDSDPDFGIPDYTFSQGAPDPTAIRSNIETYEPRVEALTDSTIDGLTALVIVEVTARG